MSEINYAKRRRAVLDSMGRCTVCGKKRTDEGYKICATCRAKIRVSNARLYWKRRAEKVCINCGASVPDGASRCPDCAKRSTEYMRKHREKEAQNG